MGYDRESLIVGLATYGFVLCLGLGLVIAGIIETIPPLWIAGTIVILISGGYLGVAIKHSSVKRSAIPSTTTPDQEEE